MHLKENIQNNKFKKKLDTLFKIQEIYFQNKTHLFESD